MPYIDIPDVKSHDSIESYPGQLQRGDDHRRQHQDVRRRERDWHGDHLLGLQQLARGHAMADGKGDREAEGKSR